jgi:hypothetical protein
MVFDVEQEIRELRARVALLEMQLEQEKRTVAALEDVIRAAVRHEVKG